MRIYANDKIVGNDNPLPVSGSFVDANGNPLFSSSNPGNVQLSGSNIQQPTDIQSVFSEIVASSTTALGANATYTSATIDMQAGDNACSRLVVNFGSDQDGELSLEGSLNGTTWAKLFAVPAGKSAEIDKRIALRYVRVVLKNGAVAQTSNFIVATRMAL